MNLLRIFVFPIALSLLLFSCKEDPKPDGRIPITITGFSLTSSAVPGGRLTVDGDWIHPFGEKINLVFVSEDQVNLPITINPDFSGELPQILLPPGNYHYYGNTDMLQISEFLPIEIEGNLQVTEASSVLLTGKTEYQLVSFSKENLKEESRITQPLESPFFSNEDYYYSYVMPDRVLKAELIFQNGEKINWALDAKAFFHSSYFFQAPPSQKPVPALSDPQLVLARSIVQIDSDFIPDQMPLFGQVPLSLELPEASGMQWISNRLFAINDGGNGATMYEIDSYHGQEIRIIKITNAENIDWEDMAVSGNYLYIGDFGNNLGNRTNLRVLRVPVQDILTKNEVQAELINFSYDRQTGTPSPGGDHRFDCEAMVYHDGQLLLFTKPTNGLGSDIYTLDPSPGTQTARFAGTMETAGWITGADMTPDGKNLVFIGYENKGIASQAFLGLIENPQLPALPGNSLKTIRLGSVALTSQTEGITINRDFRVKIAGEQIKQGGFTVPQLLSELDLKGILEN
ncbi:hypothetical protein [Algoriphagus sp. A40]|uniref:hypothetical protein n=1 Tax=Algoriphagus sp. A40 TaxID=1945863 RepID=UPI0009852E87|nr:hypothetical protein [Algoriphagus sp. A40]OOG77836.1 hypothetical protein B0E43_03470 [Algoriphagus sp. A40]